MKLSLTGNVLEAGICYQKAIEQDPNKLANRVVCFVFRNVVVCLMFTQPTLKIVNYQFKTLAAITFYGITKCLATKQVWLLCI